MLKNGSYIPTVHIMGNITRAMDLSGLGIKVMVQESKYKEILREAPDGMNFSEVLGHVHSTGVRKRSYQNKVTMENIAMILKVMTLTEDPSIVKQGASTITNLFNVIEENV